MVEMVEMLIACVNYHVYIYLLCQGIKLTYYNQFSLIYSCGQTNMCGEDPTFGAETQLYHW